MGKAINSDLAYVQPACCPNGVKPNCCTPMVFRTVWDRLVQQLFGALPLGMDTSNILPDVEIWKDGVIALSEEPPFSFKVVSSGDKVPKPTDVILYKKKYYIIGEVTSENE